jgi:hypothetical protein
MSPERSPFARLAWLHRLDTAAWERHASPWSVWTRFPILPAAVVVLFARGALGGWTVGLLAALALWSWLNPRAFPPPRSTAGWASRAVMGERVWLNRAAVPLPPGSGRAVGLALAVTLLGLPPLAWGVWRLAPGPALAGLALTLGGKLWFLDRMVRLFDAMRDHPAYRGWLR